MLFLEISSIAAGPGMKENNRMFLRRMLMRLGSELFSKNNHDVSLILLR